MTTAAILAAMTTMLPIAVSTAYAATPADNSAHLAAASSTDHRLEPLRLNCEVRLSDDIAGTQCAWSAPTSDAAAGVRLMRAAIGIDQGRQVVFRTTDLSVTEYVDTPIRTGVRYAYAVIAVNDVGRIVGRSRAVVTGVPADELPTVEPLRLHCRAGFSELAQRNRVGCEWTLPDSPARTLTLWRSVDHSVRERVALFSPPFAASYLDVVPAGSTIVEYTVLATDGQGEIVARSRAKQVDIAAAPTTQRPAPVLPGITMSVTTRIPVSAAVIDRSTADVVRAERGASD
jgi:hypothetical protein